MQNDKSSVVQQFCLQGAHFYVANQVQEVKAMHLQIAKLKCIKRPPPVS